MTLLDLTIDGAAPPRSCCWPWREMPDWGLPGWG